MTDRQINFSLERNVPLACTVAANVYLMFSSTEAYKEAFDAWREKVSIVLFTCTKLCINSCTQFL